MQLLRSGQPVPTVFDLLGNKENDMTAGLGFALSRSPRFLAHLLTDLFGTKFDVHHAVIRLQTATGSGGITDARIEIPGKALLVIEVKRGAHFPPESQLRRYVPVLQKAKVQHKLLMALTNATDELAGIMLPAALKDIQVAHRSWSRLKELAEESRDAEGRIAKRLLDEFINYMEKLTKMETRYSNMVYVVSLSSDTPEGWGLSWIDIVEKRKRYFYPVGARWPDPPNYIAFRYHGRLQSIHHLKGYDLLTNPRQVFPELPDEDWGQHYCFKLGPAIRPPHEVKAGPRVRRSNRVWCMLDTLLTCKTISDALTETDRRQE